MGISLHRPGRTPELRCGPRACGCGMSTIMIKCPQTGEAVSTGIEVERETFVALPDSGAEMRCPVCGHDHVWSKAQAWLANPTPSA
jgi:hypothetical protein